MSAAPIHFEPTDPPDLPIIPIDRDTFDAVVAKYALAVEVDAAAGVQVVELDGIEYTTPLVQEVTC